MLIGSNPGRSEQTKALFDKYGEKNIKRFQVLYGWGGGEIYPHRLSDFLPPPLGEHTRLSSQRSHHQLE